MKNTILAIVTLVSVLGVMMFDTMKAEASQKETSIQTVQNNARSLYGVAHTIEQGKGEAKAEQRFMFAFKQMSTQANNFKKDKKVQKVVKKMDKVIRDARIDFNAGNTDEAIKTVQTWVEKDYENSLKVLYNK